MQEKAVRISFDRKVEIFRHKYLWIRMRHEFFDTVLNNKESVDYVWNLSKANFDPELFTSHNHEIQNNLIINLLPYNNMSQSSKKYIDRSHETYKWDVQKIEHYTWINLFIMALALFNVSFPQRDVAYRINLRY
jgi:hypothetical protein